VTVAIGLKLQDWITLSVSVLAFIISVGTTYFTFLRQEDDVSVVFGTFPLVYMADKDHLRLEKSKTDFVFINSGTRTAAIIDVHLFFLQHRGAPKCAEVPFGSGTIFETNFEPVVIKKEEIVVRSVLATEPKSSSDIARSGSGAYLFPVAEEGRETDSVNVESCAQIFLSTPSGAQYAVQVTVSKYKALANDFVYRPYEVGAFDWTKPQVLVKHSGNIFEK
jgi:hypothetical protein